MCALKRLIGACIVLGLCTASAHSFTGDIADGPEYSWVVEVVSVCKGDGGKTQNGTAYVKSRRLIYTSAHVVYKRQELCKGVRIVTRDDAGKVAQVVPARHIFVAEGYPAAESKLTREGNGVESRIKFDPSLSADAKQSILRRAANEDMAIIIPDGDVRVLATRPDILDERLPFMEMLTTVKRHREEWTKDFRNKTLAPAVHSVFGQTFSKHALGIGYGNFECDDYHKREACKPSDGHRRMGFVEFSPFWFIHVVPGDEASISPMFLTREGGALRGRGLTPFNYGDSGGPLLLPVVQAQEQKLFSQKEINEAKPGTLGVVVGFLAMSSEIEAWHTSLLQHVALIHSVLRGEEYKKAMAEVQTLSFAVGFRTVNRRRWIRTGGTMRSSREAADAAALSLCREGGYECKVVERYTSGCGYITQGVSGASLRWFVGTTRQSVAQQCARAKHKCGDAAGGCFPGAQQ